MMKYVYKWRLRYLMILGGLFCFFMLNIIVKAEEPTRESEMAEILNELHLFAGTNQGFQLESQATRNQAAVMLVRYLGIEDFVIEAYNSNDLNHPFSDVPTWAAPHVAYLYQAGLTNGVSEHQYGGNEAITGNQYTTMLLRLLGFDDLDEDFHWSNALEFFVLEYDLLKEDLGSDGISLNKGITRGQMVRLSYLSLYLEYKSLGHRVIDSLYYNEVITYEEYDKYTTNDSWKNVSTEIKAIWISYLDLKPILQNKSEDSFRTSIQEMMNNISDLGLNTIFVQVRPFSDAIYESQVYEWSYLLTGNDGVSLGYDPFEIIIEEAKLKQLRVDAWINPYRIRNDIVKDPLNPNGRIAKMIENDPSLTIQTGNQLMFNPASDVVQELIVSGVEEIVRQYGVDGIHFDDYFYPGADFTLDALDYANYLKVGGGLSQAAFRRERIDLLVKDVYSTIKGVNNNVLFGISPQGSTANNYDHTFIDVQKWIVTPGYIDYICPQIYYGFENETLGFSKVLDEWSQMVKGTSVDLYIGLAAYKIGLNDGWAGSGNEEWMTKANRLKFMVELSRSVNNYKGVAFFRYDSLFKPTKNVSESVEKEMESLKVLFLEKEKI